MTNRPPMRPFHEFIVDQSQGTADLEMTAAIAEVTEAVNRLSKGGSVTLKLSITPAGEGRRTVLVGAKVTSDVPTPKPDPSIFYVGDHGSLHREDPYQQRIDLSGALRPADTDTALQIEED